MATNSRLRRLLFVFLIFAGFAPSLRAQSAAYFIDKESGEPRFIQRLAWAGGEYALRYEVVIERERNGTYVTHLREFTETPFIEVSLPPGEYRYQVSSYNILNKPEEVSRWKNIEVRLAVQPEIFDALPDFVSEDNSGGSEETPAYALAISGNNLVPGAEFLLRNSDGAEIIPEALDFGKDGNARLFINSADVYPGEYELIVRNPGGLEASLGGIVFPEPEPKGETPKLLKPVLVFNSAAWTPLFPLHGDFFGSGFSPAGAGINFGVVFSIPSSIYIGGELTMLLNIDNSSANNDNFGQMLSVGANLLLMKWLPNQKTALNFRLGASYIIVPDTQDKFAFNIGASFLWRFTGVFMLETGVDYAAQIKSDSFDGCLRPWLGIGVIF